MFVCTYVEMCLYNTFISVGTQCFRLGSIAQNKRQCTEYNGFTCARFASHNRKTFAKIDTQIGDNGVVVNINRL